MSSHTNHRSTLFTAGIILLMLFLIISSSLIAPGTVDTDKLAQSEPPPIQSYQPTVEPQKVDAPSEPIPAQAIIRFDPNTTEQERAAYIQSVGGMIVKQLDSLDTVVITVSENIAQVPLPESSVVAETEPDYYVSALDDLTPNDPRYAEQWALPAIGAPSLWGQMPSDAPKVTVAVIDSGICASHPDLAGRIMSGWDFLENDAVPQDDFGHGCSVAGVIAANMNDGIGIAGVAPNAQIMPLRVLNASGIGSYSDVAAAIAYAADHGAQVINLSLGGSNPSSMWENAINYAVSKGVVIVAAAGNNGTEGALYPAAYSAVIAVGSVDPNLQHSSFSNYGAQIDIWAPGRDILTIKPDGGYGLVSGTSFAAPYVAGAEAIEMTSGGKITLVNGALSLTSLLSQTNTQTNTATSTSSPTLIVATEASPTPTPLTISLPRALTDQEKESLSQAVSDDLPILLESNQFDFAYGEIYGEWIEINVWLVDSDNEVIPMTPITLFAHKISATSWDLVSSLNPSYNDVLNSLPTNMLSKEIKDTLLIPQDASPQNAISAGGFLFPWEGTKQLTQNISGAYLSDDTLYRSHFGNEIDIGGAFDILAPKDGVVVYADDSSANYGNCSDAAAAGNYIVLGHGKFANGKYDTYTLYYHLSRGSIPDYLQVAGPEIRVKAGARIGTTGRTGYATGIHLHFSASGQPVSFNTTAQVSPCSNGSSNYTNTYTRGFPSISAANSIGIGFEDNTNNWPLLGSNTATGNLPPSWNRLDLNTHYCAPNNSNNIVIVYKHRDYGGECEIFGAGQDSSLSDNYIGNDSISSALVKTGYTLALFENDNFGHPSVDLYTDTPNFSFPDAYWHDRASSYKVVEGVVCVAATDDLGSLCYVPPITAPPTTPPPTTPPPTSPPRQWHVQYYSDHNWSNEKCKRDISGSGIIGADFNENWGAGAPCPGMPTDNFSARYTGTFSFGSAGTYWFKVHHDDSAIFSIDGNVLQNWTSSGDECLTANLGSGMHALRIDYQENTGGASVGLVAGNGVCPHPTTPDPKQWHAQYYSDHNWSSLQCERYFYGSGLIGADFSENWDGGAPCPGMSTDNFSARYTGTFNVSSTANYCFHVNHDDTARLNIDGEDLQNWTHSGDDGPVRSLTAGSHNFRMDYQENTGSAHINLEVLESFCFPPGSSSKNSPTSGAIDQPTNNLTLTWELNSSGTLYEYCYDTTNDNACSSWIPAGTATSANLSGLSPTTTYYWQVRAANNRGSTETNNNTWWSFSTATDTQPPRVSTTVNVPSVILGGTALVTVRLNNPPAEGGYTSAELTCTYDQTLLEVSGITIGSLFGVDPVGAMNGPRNGSFILAMAGSKGNKATTSGAAFTFNVKALQAGPTTVECMARASKGDGKIISVPSLGPATLTIGGGTITPTFTPTPSASATPTFTPTSTGSPTPSSTSTPTATPTPSFTPSQSLIGTLTGQVLASEPVIVRLYDATSQFISSIPANPEGAFSLTVPAGTYSVVASASGFLSAQKDSVTLTSGIVTTLPTISLLAGDVDNNDVIDEWDAMTIGMNYNTITPTAADLNNDGIINFLDLELLAANYRTTGPIAWQ